MPFTPLDEWISLNPEVSPIAATTAVSDALIARGAKVISLGQGREIVELPLLLEALADEFSNAQTLVSSRYNSPGDALRQPVAAWMQRILGIETSAQTTFAIQELGRDGLDQAIRLIARQANFPPRGKILVPDSAWPMVSELLDDYNLEGLSYEMEHGNYAHNILRQLNDHGDQILGIYINSPHNPTGQILSEFEIQEIFAVVDSFNTDAHLAQRQGRKIGIILDNPYAHACPQIEREGQWGLDAGLEPFKQGTITPWIVSVSASKFFGTAQPGFTMIAAHKDYADLLAQRLRRSTGLSFFSPYFKALKTVLDPQSDTLVLLHFAQLAQKYALNRAALEEAMGSAVVDGEAGMTALIRLSPDTYLGRTLSKSDGSDFPIRDLNNVVEYLLNKYGVATVNNGFDRNGYALLRLSAAALPENYQEGVARMKAGLAEIKSSPVRRPRPVAANDSAPKSVL